jgi:quinol monooxygenase YgiN
MITITAILRARPGTEATMEQALLDVAANVAANEPGTLGFFISRKRDDPAVFTTYERFTDQAAMDAHNNSSAVARCFEVMRPILAADVMLEICEEISATIA